MNKKNVVSNSDHERLLRIHQQHLGLYARVAKKLRTSPSYVSLVASRKRGNEKIMAELVRELRTMAQ